MARLTGFNASFQLIDPRTGMLTGDGFRLLQSILESVNGTGDIVTVDGAQTLTNKTIDGDNNTLSDIATASLKTKTGLSARVVTGTAGLPNDLAMWDANGDLVDASIASGEVLVDGDIGVNVQAYSVNLDAFALKTAPTGAVVGESDTQTLTAKTIDGDDNTLVDIATASLKTRTGADAAVVTGTAGVSGNLAMWNVDGDLVDSTKAPPATGDIPGYLSGTATYNPPSMADGAGASTTVTVTGAALGDVAAASFSLSTQGITVTANVTASNTVTVRFQNETGGVIDLASGTLKAWVFK